MAKKTSISHELPAWQDGECDVQSSYEDAWIKKRFAINTEQITWLQNEIRDANIEIKKGRVDQATLNAELKSEVDRKRADSDLQAQIDAIDVGDPFDPTQLQEEIEAEKASAFKATLSKLPICSKRS